MGYDSGYDNIQTLEVSEGQSFSSESWVSHITHATSNQGKAKFILKTLELLSEES